MSKRIFTVMAMLVLLVAACTTTPPEVVEVTRVIEVPSEPEVVEREVVVTQIVEGESVEVTRVVEVIVEPTLAPPPQGGILIESSFSDLTTLNPILSSDTASSDVHDKIYQALLTTDPFSGEIVGELAEDWTVSDDGLVFTFTMRDDAVWSDGTPLTAHDVAFTYNAIASELVESPRKSNVELVETLKALDDQTLQISFSEVDCTALTNFQVGVLPAHLYAADFSDVMTNPNNDAPTVASGPFIFNEREPDSFTSLSRNPNYYAGAPNVDGWTYRVFADQSAELEAALAGETDIYEAGAQFVSLIEAEIASDGSLEMKKFFDDGYTYIGFNLADPNDPQPGWIDENENGEYDDGELPNLDQTPHPIFSDIEVRRAIAQAIDYTNIINKVVFGQGVQATSNVLPAISWAFNSEVEPPTFDLEAASAALEAAGWVDSDGDGIREKDGRRLAFTLTTNAGNEVRENIATIMQDTLSDVGIEVNLEIIEFGTVVGKLLGQTFDAVVIGWTGLGSDPEDSTFWAYRNDSPGSGFNFISYFNETVEENLSMARSLPGCDTAARGDLYREVQAEIINDAPYAFLYVPLTNVVWSERVNDIDPGPWSTYYNVENWSLTP